MRSIRAFLYQIKMELKSTVRYKFAFFSDIAVFSVLLIFFFLSSSGSSFSDKYSSQDNKELLLVGYMMWTFASAAISTMATGLNSEARNGTLVMFLHSKTPVEILLFAKLISSQIVQLIIILVLSLISRFLFHVQLSFNPTLILPFLINLVGMYGIGMVLCGVSLFFKKTGALTLLMQLVTLFVTDTLPSSDTILKITRYIPLTICNEISRLIISSKSYSYTALFGIIISIIWVVVGILVFRFFYEKSKVKGNLLFY
ncbi:hypothetical protein [Lagierella sp.]|uniref:hypothetical protein n=1 Tax=Lagierella sp. TaxID=2849657 RepID=UPI00261CFB2B|nr:hypothetical protein [Lagierella sp.]